MKYDLYTTVGPNGVEYIVNGQSVSYAFYIRACEWSVTHFSRRMKIEQDNRAKRARYIDMLTSLAIAQTRLQFLAGSWADYCEAKRMSESALKRRWTERDSKKGDGGFEPGSYVTVKD